jgi:hypothetical protein
MRRPAALLCLALLGACSNAEPVRIDGSSPERFEQTTAAARRDLPDADRLTFDRAIRTVGGRRFAERDPAALGRLTFDGMTAAEVVADQQSREQ